MATSPYTNFPTYSELHWETYIILFPKDSCVTQSSRELGAETEIMPIKKKEVNIIFQKESKSMFGAFKTYVHEGSFPS